MYRLGDKLIKIGGSGIREMLISVTGVDIIQSSVDFTNTGQTQQLTYTVSPANAANKAVTWQSSNTDIATVSSTGLVTSVGDGQATITITTVDGGFTDTCGVEVVMPKFTIASGGEITYDGDYKIHSFKTVGTSTFQVTQLGDNNIFQYLVIAGGGAGGSSNAGSVSNNAYGGGGGAGGMLEGTINNITTGSYNVVVGAGSQNSSVFGIETIAGGKGGDGFQTGLERDGQDGGSGGGAGGVYGVSPFALAGQGISGQGFYGRSWWDSSQNFGGGGGGAGNFTNTYVGGLGKASNITGSPVNYSVGGRGGAFTNPLNGDAGAANTGNGGNGCVRTSTSGYRYGGAGGSGIVIIKYKYK